ncbi:MAG TPA: hypothetical protein VJZ77_09355 [Blastocatellia bacterium]|nr:hypothetical protein [Blastocatellia bacterium]
MSIVTATAKAKSIKRGRAAAKAPKPKVVVTPGEAWVMVNKLKIGVEYLEASDRWLATFRNKEKSIYLPVPGRTAFGAVQELLAQIGVEVAHG